jgi:HEAT repeat protein
VRLQAALALGDAGSQTLLELASSERTDDAQAARAIQAVGHRLEADEVDSLLVRARWTHRPATARACVEWLGLRGGPEVIPTIAGVLASADRELAASAATALAAAGSTAAEGPLREALERGHGPEVLVAVARALGRVGSIAAVMPLRAAAERVGDGDLGHAVRQAVAEIQARLQGAAPGQLSLAGGEEGRVSLVGGDDARGQLSLWEPKTPEPRTGGE